MKYFLFGVSFSDANTGTAVGSGGTILRTTNGGTNWDTQTSGTESDLSRVSFTDADNGAAVGQFGTILRTTDGGSHGRRSKVEPPSCSPAFRLPIPTTESPSALLERSSGPQMEVTPG